MGSFGWMVVVVAVTRSRCDGEQGKKLSRVQQPEACWRDFGATRHLATVCACAVISWQQC